MKYLSIDYGLSKIGLAMGDSETKVVAPLEVIKNTGDIAKKIADLIVEENFDEVVVGMPAQQQGEVTKEFVQALKRGVKIPVHTVDESYSSVASQQIQDEFGSNVPEDALAAMVVLEQFFNERI